ncbi:hypothetical protein GCM10007383_05910 [Arenibacter certesii]|uniref:Thioredoxin domain-containing protein n=2 Tax=Arenibacter certesii TaxID=228955 RepID=A0A918MIH4_9FLAO|nr:hypothetical protein GCM10007383_05910 [Arenibacter certesii]
MDSIPLDFKGVTPDSVFIGYIELVNEKLLKKVGGNSGFFNRNYGDFKSTIYCLSGYKNGKQFYVVDANHNKDFSDDKFIEFDKKLAHDKKSMPQFLDRFPDVRIIVDKLAENKIYRDTIIISLYPDANYFTYPDKFTPDNKERLKRDLLLAAAFKDYHHGTFVTSNKEYEVAINKYGFKEPYFIFKKKKDDFPEFNSLEREEYIVFDTIQLENDYFKIDSIQYSPPSLKLKHLNIEKLSTGFRKGDISKNYNLEGIYDNNSTFRNLLYRKKLLLIDFWGTWCIPCRKLTPELVALNKEYGRDLGLVSLAFEQDVEPVREYVSVNKMNWYHGIIRGVPKSAKKPKIISDLRIEAYPTFIILDSDLKIVFRGNGNNFNEMTDFIKEFLTE